MSFNIDFARETGFFKYVWRRVLWRISSSGSIKLHTGPDFPLPKGKPFASDIFVTEGNVDWNSEFILAAFLNSLPEKRELLDVGAHIGYYSVLLSPFASKIFAFEPDPRNHPYLHAALKRVDNATVVAAAVADQIGQIAFSTAGDSSTNHIIPEATEGTFVPVVTIDDFVQRHGLNPAAIKIDIEGYDILAIQGSKGTASVCQPVYLVEYNQEENRPNTWAALESFVDGQDYSAFVVKRDPIRPFAYAYRFKEFKIHEAAAMDLKMIFLVPQIHKSWFDHLASTSGEWGNSALKPESVRSFLSRHRCL